MDDYRDLVRAGLALFCAGMMLVAGHLFIEWQAKRADAGIKIEPSRRGGSPLPSISSSSPSIGNVIELPTEVRRKRPA
ncbi:hypothetical protein FXV83_23340 [Bradyrhizobium hipponense]|uniref:Uncharacterized protein n=1 Tax=Bradyrhizobium hipponense TaxID=2605638 RepID=A0A5S4YLP9_9BRAD|nr:hypothetical protein [Bradyrhizobium sp. CSA207]TYO64295.1 hypothetical protein FXV83_23340 [Bradyrhizobium hipponense]